MKVLNTSKGNVMHEQYGIQKIRQPECSQKRNNGGLPPTKRLVYSPQPDFTAFMLPLDLGDPNLLLVLALALPRSVLTDDH